MFDLYIFDLDGTILNTEELHYQSYKEALNFFGYIDEFTFNSYCKLCHYDDKLMKNFVESELNVIYEKFYIKKKEVYLLKLKNELKLVDGFEQLFIKLKQKNIKTCIVTHSDSETISSILEKVPILKLFDKIFSRDDYINRKPHPECYIKAIDFFQTVKVY